MRILQITAGAAQMYCGSCLTDNATAAELIRQGHDVTLVPLYTPTRTDEANVSQQRVFFGGISIYLQQASALFRWTPRFLDRIWDSPAVIRAATRRSIETSADKLGALTVATLTGRHGVLRKEFEKLLDWLRTEPAPDIVVIPYTLLISLAQPLREALGCPVVCGLQGEDLFLEGLTERWRKESLDLIRGHIRHVDRFLATSQFYARLMSAYLSIPREKIAVNPLGVSLSGLDPRTSPPGQSTPCTVGYFARIAPEKGLHELAEAVRLLRRRGVELNMEAAGYLPPENAKYLEECLKICQFRYHGEVTREEKAAFLRRMDVTCVPSPYADPKGVYVLESMAVGTPVVSPDHGAFPELLEASGGGVLARSSKAEDIAAVLDDLTRNPSRLRVLGEEGASGVRAKLSIARSATQAVSIYEDVVKAAGTTRQVIASH